MNALRRCRGLVPLLALCACQEGDAPSEDMEVSDAIPTIREAWVSEGDTLLDVDTPALWTDGTTGVVLVTGKGSHDLRLYDGATGATLGALGQEGSGPGDFQRPNGVIVVGDFALVVERDNRRVQVLLMPDGTSLGSFGQDVLEYPYGLAAAGTPDELTLWVTDDYEYEEDVVPDDLTHRLHRFRLALSRDGAPNVLEHEAFGEAQGDGALRVVESIQVDAANGDVYVADESRRSYLRYDFDGSYQGSELAGGYIGGDPEGIVLVECPANAGYWIITDQQDDTSLFRVFSRGTLDFIGTFRGEVTANTDGASFSPGPVPGFPDGVFYAIHDDQGLSAFAWPDVVQALGLSAGCGIASR